MKRFTVPILVLVATSLLQAQSNDERTIKQTRIARQGTTATVDRGLFTVGGSETLARGAYSFGVGWNNTDRTPRDIDVNSFPVSVAYGLLGRLTVSATFETQRQVTARNLAQRGFYNELPFVKSRFVKGYGDTYIGAKYKLQQRRDGVGGISIGGFVKVPTADEELGLGTGEVDGGVEMGFSSLLPGRFVMHSSMAFIATRDAIAPFKVGLKDELRTGFGGVWPSTGIAMGAMNMQVLVEYATKSFVGAGTRNAVIQNPSDIAGGFRFLFLDAGLTLNVGYRNNLNFDRSFPGNRNENGWVGSFTFTKPSRGSAINNHVPVVVVEPAEEAVTAGGQMAITVSAFDADNDKLSFEWFATGGKIVGTGEQVKFDATGLSAGKYKVRATVTDGKGGSTIAEAEITVR